MAEASSPGRRLDIQGLRGIAVLVVVLYHAGDLLPGGFVGVDVFFVISGHVITLGLVKTIASGADVDLVGFTRRRVRRLLPALAAMLVAVLLISSVIGSIGAQSATQQTGLGAALFVANVVLFAQDTGYFDVTAELNPLLHTWSLSVEEQFYFVFPALIALGAFVARRRGRRAISGAAATIALLSIVSFVAMLPIAGSELAFFAAPIRAWEFGIGAATALVAPRVATAIRPAIATLAATAGFAAVLWSSIALTDTTEFPGLITLVPVGGAAALILVGPGNRVSTLLANGPLVRLGDLSYSWYLWHWPFIVFARVLWSDHVGVAVGAALMSLVPAVLSYRFVEERFRHARPERSYGTAKLALACIVAPLLAAGAVTVISSASSDNVDRYERAVAETPDVTLGCAEPTPLSERGSRCDVVRPDADLDVVVVGDSTAGMHTSALLASSDGGAGEPLANITFSTYYGCPFADVAVRRGGVVEQRCARFVAGTLDELERRQPDLVVVAIATDIYPIRENIELAPADNPTEWASDASTKAAVLDSGFARTIDRLESADIDVLIIATVPKFEPWSLRACSTFTIRFRPSSCSASAERVDLDSARAEAVEAERQAADLSGADFIDLADAVCSQRCTTFDNSEWIWRDGGHLSPTGSARTQRALADALSASVSTL